MSIQGLIACTAAELAGPQKRLLTIGAEPIASLADNATALAARIGSAGSLLEILGTLTANRPTGLFVLGDAGREFGVALAVEDGRVTSAAGPEPQQTMSAWIVELHNRATRMRGGADGGVVRELELGRTYVLEAALDGLARCDAPGASMLFVQGRHQWLHEALPVAEALDLGFILMENARRSDELGRVEAVLGETSHAVVAVNRPPEQPSVRVEPHRAESGSGWDFFDDPDPAAEGEWIDARFVFDFCDGCTSADGLAERTMLGRFRTLSAIVALVERGHVTLAGDANLLDEWSDLIEELAG